ncbi:MAG: V-type ATP synthase subunit F [Clostridiales bacterium]|nr:V-type ATP synthase subunit F [Clostridiales bacterium]
MRYYLITDNVDTQVGMRLAGVEGVVVHQRDEVQEAIKEAEADSSIAILLITEKLAAIVPDQIINLRLYRSHPLVVIIPDRHGTGRAPDSITRYIREAIGIKL